MSFQGSTEFNSKVVENPREGATQVAQVSEPPVQEPLARQQRKQAQSAPAQRPQVEKEREVPSFVFSKRYIPISLPLAEDIVEAYLRMVQGSQMRPSNQDIVVAAIMKGASRLPRDPSLTLSGDLDEYRLYRDFTRGNSIVRKELVFWVNAGALAGFKPKDPKGFMELAALEALQHGSWQSNSAIVQDKPTIAEVIGLF
jgi:hypothetical protein